MFSRDGWLIRPAFFAIARLEKGKDKVMQFQSVISRCIVLAGVLVAVVATVGCGGKGVESYEVKGRVTFQGAPVTEGQITFEDPATGFANSAGLDPMGAYTVALADGSYQVSVQPPTIQIGGGPDTPPDEGYKEVDNIPEKYHRAETSGLSAQIASGQLEHNFDLTP